MALTEAGVGASPPKPPDWGDGCPSPQTPLGKEILHGRRWVASLCRGFEADPDPYSGPGLKSKFPLAFFKLDK